MLGKKINQERGISWSRHIAILDRRDREGVTEVLTFEQRPEGSKRAPSNIYDKSLRQECLACSRNSNEASVAKLKPSVSTFANAVPTV